MNYILFAQSVSYLITEIVEEKVPLSDGVEASYYWWMICAVIGIVCLLSIIGYMIWCSKYRKRIIELQGGHGERVGWNYRKLQARISELEMKSTEDLMSNMIFE